MCHHLQRIRAERERKKERGKKSVGLLLLLLLLHSSSHRRVMNRWRANGTLFIIRPLVLPSRTASRPSVRTTQHSAFSWKILAMNQHTNTLQTRRSTHTHDVFLRFFLSCSLFSILEETNSTAAARDDDIDHQDSIHQEINYVDMRAVVAVLSSSSHRQLFSLFLDTIAKEEDEKEDDESFSLFFFCFPSASAQQSRYSVIVPELKLDGLLDWIANAIQRNARSLCSASSYRFPLFIEWLESYLSMVYK